MGRAAGFSLINCAVNPQAAGERVTACEPILKSKKVLTDTRAKDNKKGTNHF